MKLSAKVIEQQEEPSNGPDIQALFRAHAPHIHALLLRLLGPGADSEADDQTQEVFLLAHKKLEQFDGRNARAWLTSIAVNMAMKSRRSYWFRRLFFGAGRAATVDARADSPEELLAEREACLQLYAMLDMLPARQRAAFILLDIEGLSTEEAAVALRCSPRTIYNCHSQARRALLANHARGATAKLPEKRR